MTSFRFADYAVSRYGKYSEAAIQAWQILKVILTCVYFLVVFKVCELLNHFTVYILVVTLLGRMMARNLP